MFFGSMLADALWTSTGDSSNKGLTWPITSMTLSPHSRLPYFGWKPLNSAKLAAGARPPHLQGAQSACAP
eukprot:2872315-Amphidinium_carterae.1